MTHKYQDGGGAIDLGDAGLKLSLVKRGRFKNIDMSYSDIGQVRFRRATTFFKGYILILPKGGPRVPKSIFHERLQQNIVNISHKSFNETAQDFVDCLKARL